MTLEFDLELALLAVKVGSGRIVTRTGDSVKITGWGDNPVNSEYPITGTMFDDGLIRSWTRNGKYYGDESFSTMDLFIEEIE